MKLIINFIIMFIISVFSIVTLINLKNIVSINNEVDLKYKKSLKNINLMERIQSMSLDSFFSYVNNNENIKIKSVYKKQKNTVIIYVVEDIEIIKIIEEE